MRTCPLLLAVFAVFVTPAVAQDSLTQADLLLRMIDVSRLSRPSEPAERSLLFSSFDRRQFDVENNRYVHWDADEDANQFIRTTDDGWNVMAEIDGPGAIWHIGADKPAGKVRILLDGKTVIDAEFADLFNGGVAPFGEPLAYFMRETEGANLYYPIGFQKRCQVLSQGFAGAYQIDASNFARETRVQTFTPSVDAEGAAALERVIDAFKHGLSDDKLLEGLKTGTVASQQDLKYKEKFVETFNKPGTIRALYVSLTNRREPRTRHAMHNCIIRMWWDGEETPSVELPLATFFGTGFDRNAYNSIAMGTDRWLDLPGVFASESYFMYCLLPMPFRSGARIEIENLNDESIGLMLYMRTDRAAPPEDSFRFHAHFRKEDPCKTFDYPLLEATGAGRIVGCVLNIDCPRDEWWGTGDHKIWLDGEPFPSILGTGTADYFGSVTGLVPVARPMHGATLVNPHGKNSVYRWLFADAIDFHKSVRFTLENWQKNRADDVYYSSTVYWYGQPGVHETSDRLTQRDLSLPGLRIPGSVEVEGNVIGKDWGNVLSEKHARVELSGEAAANITTTEPVTIVVPSEHKGEAMLRLRVRPGRSFEMITVALADGTPVGVVKYDRESDGTYDVGKIDMGDGRARMTVTCSKAVALDCWIVEPLPE